MRDPVPESALPRRDPGPWLLGGSAVATVSVVLAAAAGGPYLSLESLSPWIVTYGVGLFCALFSLPFAIHRRLGWMLEEDARWERALLAWGAATIAVLAAALVCGAVADFDSGRLAGALAIVTIVEAGLVLGTLLLWLISG